MVTSNILNIIKVDLKKCFISNQILILKVNKSNYKNTLNTLMSGSFPLLISIYLHINEQIKTNDS